MARFALSLSLTQWHRSGPLRNRVMREALRAAVEVINGEENREMVNDIAVGVEDM